jgi:ectoine hydroxylase-related dioxygenase (phytanoyl-CoA dioxygenase family)
LRKKNRKKFAYFFDTLQTSSALINFWTNSKILKIIEKIMKCNKAFISATDLLLRMDSPVDERNKLDWHQDSAYFKQNKYGYNGLNCWTTLTRLTYDMGPLEILEKSHKVGCLKVKKKRNNKFGSLQRKISEKITNKFILKKFEMNPGDVLFMDMDTMHRSGSNLSKIFRFSSICRYHNMSANDFNPGLNIYRYSDKKLNKEIHGF